MFTITPSGFVVAAIVFATLQSVLSPLIFKLATMYASAFLGSVGLVSTFVALLVVSFFPGVLSISGISTWILAMLIVWLVTAIATWLLPLLLLKNRREPRL